MSSVQNVALIDSANAGYAQLTALSLVQASLIKHLIANDMIPADTVSGEIDEAISLLGSVQNHYADEHVARWRSLRSFLDRNRPSP